ncbi:MAG: alpha/beta hydrolase [SAR324 cluster bacterium]|nr:alpha/beta hydrolase [SAR324 cluster bacterium]
MIFLLVLIGGFALLAAALYVFQRHLIYHPRNYDKGYEFHNFESVVELKYQTAEGNQVSFYLPPKTALNGPPETLWILFGGNASLALDWYDFVQEYPDSQAGFLLIEYPGYGKCEGKASPESILLSTEKALDRLAQFFQLERAQLESNIRLMGHSLGTGPGLQFAVRHPVNQIVLVSPFTSLQDMACRVVGKPLCYLLKHHFDNENELARLVKQSPTPGIQIFHGTNDPVIPVEMSRRLAEKFPSAINYYEIPEADHNFILSLAQIQIFQIMQNAPAGTKTKRH